MSGPATARPEIAENGATVQNVYDPTGRIITARWVEAMRLAGLPQEKITEVLNGAVTRPEDLITAKEAEADPEIGVPASTINTWKAAKHLEGKGRRKGPGPGGVVLYDPTDIKALRDSPPKMGRPRKFLSKK